MIKGLQSMGREMIVLLLCIWIGLLNRNMRLINLINMLSYIGLILKLIV